jgi:cyclopropane fatty-acyl-phospholipid synthase-like methyltransferase
MTLENASTFLDIGSGFGKPVFHAAMQTACVSLGVEIVPARVTFCID